MPRTEQTAIQKRGSGFHPPRFPGSAPGFTPSHARGAPEWPRIVNLAIDPWGWYWGGHWAAEMGNVEYARLLHCCASVEFLGKLGKLVIMGELD